MAGELHGGECQFAVLCRSRALPKLVRVQREMGLSVLERVRWPPSEMVGRDRVGTLTSYGPVTSCWSWNVRGMTKTRLLRNRSPGAVLTRPSVAHSFMFILLGWLSGLSASPPTGRSPVQSPLRAHAWVVGQVPNRGCVRGNQSMFLLYMFVFLPSSPLSKNK